MAKKPKLPKIPKLPKPAEKMSKAEMKAYGETVAKAIRKVANKEVVTEFLRNANPLPFHEWVKDVTLDGKPFTYERHEYLVEPYQDNHLDMVFLKATQMGLTSYAMLKIIYLARWSDLRSILYFFPSRTDVVDFVKGRINPLIEENSDTINTWVRETNAANIKQVWNTMLYFRGMRSRVGMKGTPGDMIVIDELDEADEKFEFWLKMRLAHADDETKRMLKLSNPTMPDSGIDKEFQKSDQKYWLLKCEKCGKYTDLVESFPDCLASKNGGDVVRLCMNCRDRALDPANGVWVAKKPGVIEKRGYQFSQLWSQFRDPTDIMEDYHNSEYISDFWNLTIGLAHVEAQNRLSIEEVLALCGDNEIASSDPGPCFMGVDQGNDLHVVIGKRNFGKAGEIIHIGVYKEWEELDSLMRNFNITRCVVDDSPEIRPPRDLARRFPGKIFLNNYNIHQIGNYAWNERELRVSANRTETLDASHREIMDMELILPKQCDIVREFAGHLHNIAKRLEEEYRTDTDGTRYKTGIKKYVYRKLGADHFRHAWNYEAMARQFGMRSLFGGCVS